MMSYRLIIPKYYVYTSNIEVKHDVISTHYPKVLCLCIKQSSRYEAKSLNHEIQVTVTHFYFEIKHQVILTHYPII